MTTYANNPIMDDRASVISETTTLAGSTYDAPVEFNKQDVSAMTTLNMFYTTSRLNATLHYGEDSSSPAVYYLESNTVRIKPSLLLRKGASKSSPVAAFARTNWMLRNMTIGLGDYHKEAGDDEPADRLTRDKNTLRRSDYRATVWVQSADAGQKPISFIWKKDKSVTFKTVYVCVDDAGNIIGRLRSGGMLNWKKAAEIDMSQNLGEDERALFLVSAGGVWALEGLNYRSWGRGYEKN